MKRIISVALILALLLSLFAVPALADTKVTQKVKVGVTTKATGAKLAVVTYELRKAYDWNTGKVTGNYIRYKVKNTGTKTVTKFRAQNIPIEYTSSGTQVHKYYKTDYTVKTLKPGASAWTPWKSLPKSGFLYANTVSIAFTYIR